VEAGVVVYRMEGDGIGLAAGQATDGHSFGRGPGGS
jgi:hypothetical protein